MTAPDKGRRPRAERKRGSHLTENLRAAFRQYRLMQGLTLEQVAARYNPPVTDGNVCDVENAPGELTIGRAVVHAHALGIDLRFVFTPLPDEET